MKFHPRSRPLVPVPSTGKADAEGSASLPQWPTPGPGHVGLAPARGHGLGACGRRMCIGRDACMSGRAMVASACGCGMPEESGEASETAGPPAPRWHSAETQQRVSRVGNLLLTVVSSLWCVYLLAQFFSTWDVTVHSRSATHWSILTATLVLGVEIGALVMTGLLVFLVPRMIMTWTTTVVFEYVFGKGLWKQQVIIRDGRKIAREIAVSILKCVIKEANFVGATVVLFCLLSVSKMLISSQPSPTASC